MTTLCSFNFNKMFDANVYSVACYFLVGSAQMLVEISQISGAHMSPTPCRGDSVLDTPSACSWAASKLCLPSASPESTMNTSWPWLQSQPFTPHLPLLLQHLTDNRLPALGGLSVSPLCASHSQLPLLSGEPVAGLMALCSRTHLQQLPLKV